MNQQLYYLQNISSLHVGTGQGTGIIDLPIAREKASNLPLVPGSAIKGVLRDELRPTQKNDDSEERKDYLALFGPETGETASDHAGALAVGDARLLCLPIRSWNGTFAWATCPMILQRFQRDLDTQESIPSPDSNQAIHYQASDPGTLLKDDNDMIFLEDLDLLAITENANDFWADTIAEIIFDDPEWQKMFKQRFIILADNVFDFLAETATEVRARIRIKETTRTVQNGALWYEEYLPAETLLWGIIACDRSRKEGHPKDANYLLELLPTTERLQIGGNATVGAGQVRWILPSQAEE